MNLRWKIVIAIAVLFIIVIIALDVFASRTYEMVPDPFHGKWENADADISYLQTVSIDADAVTLIDKGGETSTCHVINVEVNYSIIRGHKETKILCDLKQARSRSQFVPCRNSPDFKLLHWEISLRQKDSEDYGSIELSDLFDTNCYAEYDNNRYFKEYLVRRAEG